MTPDDMRVRINRLSLKLSLETDQAECDRLEAELQTLEALAPSSDPVPQPRGGRG